MEKKISSLLSVDTNAKTVKGQKRGYLTGILYLAPSNESGTINVCPHASAGCRAACLYTAGMGSFSNVKQARINKTLWFARDRESFVAQIKSNIFLALIVPSFRTSSFFIMSYSLSIIRMMMIYALMYAFLSSKR